VVAHSSCENVFINTTTFDKVERLEDHPNISSLFTESFLPLRRNINSINKDLTSLDVYAFY
jgi:hypothetical protein